MAALAVGDRVRRDVPDRLQPPVHAEPGYARDPVEARRDPARDRARAHAPRQARATFRRRAHADRAGDPRPARAGIGLARDQLVEAVSWLRRIEERKVVLIEGAAPLVPGDLLEPLVGVAEIDAQDAGITVASGVRDRGGPAAALLRPAADLGAIGCRLCFSHARVVPVARVVKRTSSGSAGRATAAPRGRRVTRSGRARRRA